MTRPTPSLRRQRMAERTIDLRGAVPLPPAPALPPRRAGRPSSRPEAVPPRTPEPQPATNTARPRRRWRRAAAWLQYPLIATGALLAAYSTSFGQWLVLGFVVLALITRRTSSLSFGAAIFLLVTIPLFQALGQSGIAENLAVYCYEVLVFGVVQAIWEARQH